MFIFFFFFENLRQFTNFVIFFGIFKRFWSKISGFLQQGSAFLALFFYGMALFLVGDAFLSYENYS
jgi:hypothetical protein